VSAVSAGHPRGHRRRAGPDNSGQAVRKLAGRRPRPPRRPGAPGRSA